ncbi:hypothetical protein N644_0489 [Lactiplantibacillus paraplantarum]|nr:hypothetical protein N644_0489 [Lactiplantibacillus paraplantarum]
MTGVFVVMLWLLYLNTSEKITDYLQIEFYERLGLESE